jgi:hypothetical protein
VATSTKNVNRFLNIGGLINSYQYNMSGGGIMEGPSVNASDALHQLDTAGAKAMLTVNTSSIILLCIACLETALFLICFIFMIYFRIKLICN